MRLHRIVALVMALGTGWSFASADETDDRLAAGLQDQVERLQAQVNQMERYEQKLLGDIMREESRFVPFGERDYRRIGQLQRYLTRNAGDLKKARTQLSSVESSLSMRRARLKELALEGVGK